jgi:hypothetical protein
MQLNIQKYGQSVGVAGQISDNGEGYDIVSRFNLGAIDIPFGVGVAANTTKRNACQALATSGDTFMGVNVWGMNHTLDIVGGDLEAGGLKQYAGLQVMQAGRIYVVIDPSITTIVANVDRAFVRYSTNGGNTVIGAFSNVSDAGHNLDITKLAIFRSGIFTAADGSTKIAELQLVATVKP